MSAAAASPASAPIVVEGRPRRYRRVSTPTVLQLEAVECGAAALAMVLAHHGRIVPLEQLRVDCGVSRDGSKASNIVRAARKYGLDAKGFRKEPTQLRGVKPPAILHWNFNHFVVLEGFGRKGVYINDPANGRTVVSQAELDEAFTGVVLTFERTDTFTRGGSRPSFLRALRRHLGGAFLAVAFVVLAGIALVVPGLATSTFHKIFLDDVVVGNLAHWVKPLLLAMVATALLVFALTALQERYLLRLENRLSLSGSGRFFWHVLRLPIGFFTQRFAGDIAERVSIVNRVSSLLSGDLARTVLSLLMVGFYGLLLFVYDAYLATIGVVTALLNLIALRMASKQRVFLTQRLAGDRGKLMSTAMGALQTIDTIKASGTEGEFLSRWAGYQAKVVAGEQKLAVSTLVLSYAPPLMMGLNTALILGLGGLRIMDGHLTMGLLLAFQTLLASFLGPVGDMVKLGGTAQEVKGDMARLDDVMQAPIDQGLSPAAGSPTTARLDKLSGRIELAGLTFGYSRLEAPLIQDLNLRLRPGSRVALVGGSGSGKSTVARLIAGLLEPWSGEIRFDGVPRHGIRRAALVESLSMVDQEISLFEGDVRSNLKLWDGTLADADMIVAAKDACIHDEIVARPGGYGAAVEEGGRNFSGGQRQRLELARALAVNPSILILDEATSALDPTTEKTVEDNLRRRGCTCVIVAHRLSTIRDCDEILVLQHGKIVQRGRHETLIGEAGLYRTLILAEDRG